MSFRAPQTLLSLFQTTPARVILTLLLAWAAASLCVMLRTPLPWMIGPLLATAVVSMLGAATASWIPLRNGGQWIIGCALGLYFTPQVVALVAGLWWAIALNIVWALALGLVFGEWLYWVHHGPGPCTAQGRPKQAQPPRGWSLRLRTCLSRFGQATEAKRPASRGLQGLAQHTKWQAWGPFT
jgi:hypothetical protein